MLEYVVHIWAATNYDMINEAEASGETQKKLHGSHIIPFL